MSKLKQLYEQLIRNNALSTVNNVADKVMHTYKAFEVPTISSILSNNWKRCYIVSTNCFIDPRRRTYDDGYIAFIAQNDTIEYKIGTYYESIPGLPEDIKNIDGFNYHLAEHDYNRSDGKIDTFFFITPDEELADKCAKLIKQYVYDYDLFRLSKKDITILISEVKKLMKSLGAIGTEK